jgi:hypothetical protein
MVASQERARELYDKGLRAYSTGKLNEAITLWRGTLELDPHHPKLQTTARRLVRGTRWTVVQEQLLPLLFEQLQLAPARLTTAQKTRLLTSLGKASSPLRYVQVVATLEVLRQRFCV